MTNRFKRLRPEEMSVEQQRVVASALEGKRGKLTPPLNVLLRSAPVAELVERLGAHARFESALSERLKEIVILFCVQRWQAEFPRRIHHARAIAAGLDPTIADQIAAGERPTGLRDDDALVYGFCRALLEDSGVGDALFGQVIAALGESGVADLIGLMGYYFMLAMAHKLDPVDPSAA